MNTYREIFKWGDKHEECLNEGTKQIIKEEFGWEEPQLQGDFLLGKEDVALVDSSRLTEVQIKRIEDIVGKNNIEITDFSRAAHAYGKYFTDLLNLRMNYVPSPPDAVVYPVNESQIAELLLFCNAEKIPITPCGGGSSVTRGVETPKGGISVDLSRNLNKMLRMNPVSQTATVQAGIMGPVFEGELNRSGYSCGHFPQSFEYSTVGGWVAARGAGQASTGYGKIEDMVLGMRVVTLQGTIVTKPYPKTAQAWNLNEVFMGSEGTLGIIVEVTMKIVKHRPKNRAYASFVFHDFECATTAMRKMIQGEFGKPHLFRLSDPKETDIALKMRNFNGTLSDKVLRTLGYEAGKRCLMFVAVEGDRDYTRFVKRKLKSVAKKSKGFYIGKKPTKKWLEQRFHSAYLREPLMDMGIITDTLETAIDWQQLVPLWRAVQAYMKKRPKTIVMTHLSHIYETGANLYFTFLSPMKRGEEMEDYLEFHKGIVDAITENGGSLSHHHGVGRTLIPWMNKQFNAESLELFQGIKSYLDPNCILNPGALGLE